MSDTATSRSLIWATRGRSWGFRFLLDGGFPDPLATYEKGFSCLEGVKEGCWRSDSGVALRIQDPEGRRDAAGRPILHEFIVLGPLSDGVTSVENGLDLIWPLVAGAFSVIWDQPRPPAVDYVRNAIDGSPSNPG